MPSTSTIPEVDTVADLLPALFVAPLLTALVAAF